MLHVALKTSFPVVLCGFYTQQADVEHICFKGCAVHSGGAATRNACVRKGTSSLAVGCHGVGVLSLLRPGTRLPCLGVLLHVCCTMPPHSFTSTSVGLTVVNISSFFFCLFPEECVYITTEEYHAPPFSFFSIAMSISIKPGGWTSNNQLGIHLLGSSRSPAVHSLLAPTQALALPS